jgi:FMN phosphatase YigB (HAD superfamily)
MPVIRLALFDVGETLIHDGKALPHAADALEVISRFERSDRTPLVVGVVSDYRVPEPPATEQKIAALEREFVEILRSAGLDGFFAPPELRITLSTRAGVRKPAREIFELACARSGTGATIGECSFVTEDLEHLRACRALGMTVVRFGGGAGFEPAFESWADAPPLFAALIAPESQRNRELATEGLLAARYAIHGFRPSGPRDARHVQGQADRWVQLRDSRLGALDGVYVEIPCDVELEFGADGRVARVKAPPPDAESVRDAATFVASLVAHRKVALPGVPAPGATHAVEAEESGRRRLVRRRFSAL